MKLRSLAVAIAALIAAPVHAGQLGGWEVSDKAAPLTGLRVYSGTLTSSNEIANMLGHADHASLVIRCSEGALAVYVNWPQVVTHDGENFAGNPKTLAVWRIDDGKLDANYWDISTSGTAAGEFQPRNAAKFLSRIRAARKLVVRLTGQGTQDAQFDLAQIDMVAAAAAAGCGITLK